MSVPKLLIPAVAALGLAGAAVYFVPCMMGPCDGAPAAVADYEDEADTPCEVPCEPPCEDDKALAAAEDEEPCPMMAAMKHEPALADANDDEPCPCPGKAKAEADETQLAANAPTEAAPAPTPEAAAEPKT